jgi:hypothetical protein
MTPTRDMLKAILVSVIVVFLVLHTALLLVERKPLEVLAARWSGGPPADPISLHIERLQPLRTLLPPGETVGYIQSSGGGDWEFMATQYALAPVVVEQNTSHRLVIGNFREAVEAQEAIKQRPLIADLGRGILLMRGDAWR